MTAFDTAWGVVKDDFDDSRPAPIPTRNCDRCSTSYPLIADDELHPASPDTRIHFALTSQLCKECRHDKIRDLKWTGENHPQPNIIGLRDRKMIESLAPDLLSPMQGGSSTQDELDWLNNDCDRSSTRFRNSDQAHGRGPNPIEYHWPLPPCTCGGCAPLRWYETEGESNFGRSGG